MDLEVTFLWIMFQLTGENQGAIYMYVIHDQIVEASKAMKISYGELSVEETASLCRSVTRKYANNSKHQGFLWESFVNRVSVNNKNAWRWIKDFIDSEAIMFFNLDDEKHSFRFLNGSDIVKVLEETFAFEFYITNDCTDYVICFNHHDYLICCGKAETWLRNFIMRK